MLLRNYTNDTLSKATLSAQAGLWYNTLEVVLAAPNEPRLKAVKSALLKQVANGAEIAMKEQENLALSNSAVHELLR